MIKKSLLFLLIIIVSVRVYAQVNLQTGSATFSLPMFNWQDDKSRLNLAVALNYNSGNGLKVNDVATNVGQGWSLLAGGVITRIQAGEPDDQKPRDGTSEDQSKYPAGYLYNTTQISTGAPISLTKYPIYKDQNHIYKQHNIVADDREMDHFAFQFNGRSGVFILDKIGSYLHGTGSTGEGLMLGDSKMKITFSINENMSYNGLGVRTTIDSFTIQDENGLLYKFTKHDLTKVLKTQYCDKNLNPQTQPKFKDGQVYHEASFDDPVNIINPYIITAWYLTEIEDPLTTRKIDFTYPDTDIRHINANAGISVANYTSNNTGLFTPAKNYSLITHATSITETPAIYSITCPDGHVINFRYGSNRIDLNGDSVLSSVDILYRDRHLSKYQLTTSYFILNRYGIPVSDYEKQCARLCLKSVKKIGVDLKADDPPYKFDYFLGSSSTWDFVPPPFFHLKDIWGYYNANNSVNINGDPILPTIALSDLDNNAFKGLCFNGTNILSANPGYAKNGLLKQITYPTGGSLNYDYSQNTGVFIGQSTTNNVGGVHVSSTSVTDGGYSNDCNHPIQTTYAYNLDGSSQSSLWGLESPVNSLTAFNHYAPEYKYVLGTLFPPSIGCDYRYKYPGILSRDQAASISMIMQTLQFAMNVYSTISTIKTIISTISSGDPVSLIIEIVLDFAMTCLGDHHVDNTTNIYYNSDLNSSNPLPTQFKRVEVTEASGTNGKTVYEFTSDDFYPIWTPNNPTFSSEQRYAPWAYGLPEKVTTYDASNFIVKQTENIYDTSHIKSHFGNIKDDALYGYYGYGNCKSLVTYSSSQESSDWENPDNFNPYNSTGYPTGNFTDQSIEAMLVRMYGVYTGRVELKTTYERQFKQASSQYLESVTNYLYNSNNYQVNEIISTQSNGDQNDKTIKYDIDYYGGIFATLSQNNILNIPIATTNAVTKNGGSKIYLNETVTEFATLANGDIRPYRTLEQRFNQPQSSIVAYDGTASDNPSYKQIQTFTYDGNSNLTGMKDEGNHTVANVYGYDDKYVIGSTVNATPDRVAYTSFESSDYGGWTINGGSTILTNNGNITGAKSLSGSMSASVSQGDYILSLWSSGNTWVNGQPISVGPKEDLGSGKRYFEIKLNNMSSITVAGDNIDEVRLYPQNARMRTVTYDPLIGKISECDENNRITYYEYDNNSRLRFIKDENGNVVKMYEYNIANKATGCPTTYTNLAVSEIFTRNNCASGSIGGTIIYSIPAGKYTSTISQDIVDEEVQNELDSYGQAYANTNGTCTQLYYNTAISQTFSKQGCDSGYTGSSITYTVAAGKYISTLSQADANQQAQDDMDANGQAYTNLPGNGSCVISTTPVWIGTGVDECQSGHKLVQVIDQNPNSSTFNQTQWIDTGVDSTCGAPACDYTNCYGKENKCVNGSCETGIKVYTGVTDYINGQTYCEYHYEWSDGSWSQTYNEPSDQPCFQGFG